MDGSFAVRPPLPSGFSTRSSRSDGASTHRHVALLQVQLGMVALRLNGLGPRVELLRGTGRARLPLAFAGWRMIASVGVIRHAVAEANRVPGLPHAPAPVCPAP